MKRRTREAPATLFDVSGAEAWREHWWGMPSYEMGDATSGRRITVHFFSIDDVVEFARRLGLHVTPATDSLWFPPESVDRASDWEYIA